MDRCDMGENQPQLSGTWNYTPPHLVAVLSIIFSNRVQCLECYLGCSRNSLIVAVISIMLINVIVSRNKKERETINTLCTQDSHTSRMIIIIVVVYCW